MSRTAVAPPTGAAFDAELQRIVIAARSQGQTHLDISARELHNGVGGYPPAPGEHHRMPQAVASMRPLAGVMPSQVLTSPPSGMGG